MQRKTWGSIVAVITLAAPALGQESKCTNLKEGGSGNLQSAYDCIATYQAEIGELKTAISGLLTSMGKATEQLERLDTIPKSAVVLSATRCEDFGWEKLEGSLGRTVIGAGAARTVPDEKYVSYDRFRADGTVERVELRPYLGKPYRALESGGAETVRLTEVQMPAHSHSYKFETMYRSSVTAARSGETGKFEGVVSEEANGTTEIVGNGTPHNNMPPYIALYFCKKD